MRESVAPGELNGGQQDALVLIRQERAGKAVEQIGDGAADQDEYQQEDGGVTNHAVNAALVAMRRPLEVAVEPAEQASFLGPVFGLLSRVAQRAGVRIKATMTESTIAETIVTENCR